MGYQVLKNQGTIHMMDHAQATRTFAAEQYLLGELSEQEREEFEKHYFDCPDCVETVEAGAALVANAKAVFAEQPAWVRAEAPARKRWWSFVPEWRFAPAAALAGWAVAAVLGGYQVLRAPSEPGLVLAPAAAVRATRAGQALTFSKQKGIIAFTIAHEWEEAYGAYLGQIDRTSDHRVVLSSQMAAAPAGNPLAVTIRTERLAPGDYTLTLYGISEGAAQKTALERISFTLTE